MATTGGSIEMGGTTVALNSSRMIMDAEWISRYWGTTHLVAKADRTQKWISTEGVVLKRIRTEIFMVCRWSHRGESQDRLEETLRLFEDGSSQDGPGLWDVSRGDPVEILIVDQNDMFTGTKKRKKKKRGLSTTDLNFMSRNHTK
jgi:hypothetical protein